MSFGIQRWSIRWAIVRLLCSHTHTFQLHLTDPYPKWESQGQRKDDHRGISLNGCYLCGHVWVNDFMGPNGPSHPWRAFRDKLNLRSEWEFLKWQWKSAKKVYDEIHLGS